jgi:hypothetical protein
MERYLVYDSACSACNHLAHEIEGLAGNKLQALSIHDDAAKTLLDQAYPGGWRHAPYLLGVQDGRVSASTGVGAVTRLGLLLGPRKARRAWALARRSGVSVADLAAPPGASLSRRYVLKLFGAVAAAGGLFATRGVLPVSADWCPECSCANYWDEWVGCVTTGCGACSPPNCWHDYYVRHCLIECFFDWCSCWAWDECTFTYVRTCCTCYGGSC